MRELITALQRRGVLLEVVDGKLRCRGSLTETERKTISHNAQLIAAILEPDETLPDEIVIPREVPNNVIAIQEYLDSQRRKVAA